MTDEPEPSTSIHIHTDQGWQEVDGITHVRFEPAWPTPREAARVVLVRRLVDHHQLTVDEALTAVLQAEEGATGPHTDLARTEAAAIVHAVVGPIRDRIQEALRAMIPALEAAAAGFRKACAALNQAQYALAPPPAPGRRPDRPAWQSPYGPPTRRH